MRRSVMMDRSGRWAVVEMSTSAVLVALLLLLAGCADTDVSGIEETAASSAISTVSPTPDTATADATVDATAASTTTPEPAGDSSTPDSGDGQDGTVELAYSENSGGGGGTNQVRVVNQTDGGFRFRADTQLNRIPGPKVAPRNIAYAYASCSDCQTFAVALQINLISRSANYVAPENVAVALNYECQNCYTVARAIQYTYSVDDPTQVPKEVSDLLKELDRELQAIKTTRDITVEEAEARLDAVIAQFRELAESLNDQRDEATEQSSPDATPEPEAGDGTATPGATETAAPTPTVDSTETAGTSDETPDADGTPSPGETSELTATPEPTEDVTATP